MCSSVNDDDNNNNNDNNGNVREEWFSICLIMDISQNQIKEAQRAARSQRYPGKWLLSGTNSYIQR